MMGISSRPQSQRSGNQSRGTDVRAMRGTNSKNKDTLKADRTNNMAGKPAAQKDQFGSRHNNDNITKEQRRAGTPNGPSDLAFRESAQETRGTTGKKNRMPPTRKRK
jgi:hypothetical protein